MADNVKDFAVTGLFIGIGVAVLAPVVLPFWQVSPSLWPKLP
jgi:hypothetical protein